MRLIILGLRRSGTTIFWSTFRQDQRFRCYNEPFNSVIRHIGDPEWHNLVTYRELRELYEKDPWTFWDKYRAIPRMEEIQEGFSDKQREYFEYLLASSEHTAFDTTRCHFKIAALHNVAPDAVVVHLYRPPYSHVTSVIRPSTSLLNREPDRFKRSLRKLRRAARNLIVRKRFWSLETNYHNWGLEEIIGRSPNSPFGYRLREIGLNPEEVYAMPLVGKLLAFWRVNYEKVEQDAPRYYGDRFISVNFDEFCLKPQIIVSRIYDMLGSQPPNLDFRTIHPPHGPYQQYRPEWGHYNKRLGLPAIA